MIIMGRAAIVMPKGGKLNHSASQSGGGLRSIWVWKSYKMTIKGCNFGLGFVNDFFYF